MVGVVSRAQVPIIVTFDDDHVELIANSLGNAIETAYSVYAMFGNLDEGDFYDD